MQPQVPLFRFSGILGHLFSQISADLNTLSSIPTVPWDFGFGVLHAFNISPETSHQQEEETDLKRITASECSDLF